MASSMVTAIGRRQGRKEADQQQHDDNSESIAIIVDMSGVPVISSLPALVIMIVTHLFVSIFLPMLYTFRNFSLVVATSKQPVALS